MDGESFNLNVDYVGSSGILRSVEQKAALQTSLAILKANYKFKKVKYWGRIKGLKDDYHIAQGIGNDELMDKRTLYSKDCVSWGLLPPATEKMKKESKLAKGRFTGDPSYEFEHVEIKKTLADNEEVLEEEETTTIKEEDRLSAAIAEIDEDVCIVPRGAYMKTALGQVVTNRSFEGLSVSDSGKFSSYLHFREPKWLPEKSLLQKANMDRAIDFLDVIEEDIPKGSWSIQFERGSGLVTLRSLLWQGFTFYHVPGTRKFGSVYDGTGEKNLDLPFML